MILIIMKEIRIGCLALGNSSETLSRWYLKPSITRMVTRLKCIKYDDVLDYSFMMSSQLYARVFFDFGDNSTDSNQFDWY